MRDLDSYLKIELPEEYQDKPKNHNVSTSNFKWGKGFIQCKKNNKRKSNTLDSNESFFDYCDSCDKGFKTTMQRANHYAGHVKCKVEGCKFEAHKDIVDEHWKNFHGPRSKKFRNIKDINEYLKERKNLYPTKRRIEKKFRLAKEKLDKGIVLNSKRIKKKSKHNKKKNNKRPYTVMEEQDKKVYSGDSNPMDLVVSDSKVTDKEISVETSAGVNVVKVKSCSALASLMATYSCSDEDSDTNMQTDQVENKQNENINVTVTQKEEKVSVVPQPKEKVNKKQSKRKRKQKKNYNTNSQELSFMDSPSLLQKLLAKEILKEKNDILQCVRFIIKNNFFE